MNSYLNILQSRGCAFTSQQHNQKASTWSITSFQFTSHSLEMKGYFLLLIFQLSLILPIIVHGRSQSGSIVSSHYPESYSHLFFLNLL